MASMDDVYKIGGGLLMGAAVGLTAGILLAPRSGKETRDEIKAKAVEAQEKTQEMLEQTKERVEQIYEQGREMVAEKRDWAAETIESGREALMGLKEDVKKDTKELATAGHSRAKK